jgi:hypothetical protein
VLHKSEAIPDALTLAWLEFFKKKGKTLLTAEDERPSQARDSPLAIFLKTAFLELFQPWAWMEGVASSSF